MANRKKNEENRGGSTVDAVQVSVGRVSLIERKNQMADELLGKYGFPQELLEMRYKRTIKRETTNQAV